MPQAFLRLEIADTADNLALHPKADKVPGREEVRILVVGSTPRVERVIQELFIKRFAEIREWSDPIPTGRLKEVMRVLTRFVISE